LDALIGQILCQRILLGEAQDVFCSYNNSPVFHCHETIRTKLVALLSVITNKQSFPDLRVGQESVVSPCLCFSGIRTLLTSPSTKSAPLPLHHVPLRPPRGAPLGAGRPLPPLPIFGSMSVRLGRWATMKNLCYQYVFPIPCPSPSLPLPVSFSLFPSLSLTLSLALCVCVTSLCLYSFSIYGGQTMEKGG
jgi:hypothetical protein